MKTVTQTILYRQALINYSQKYGVTKAAIRYKTNRQYIYRWQGRYDGTWHIYDLTNTKSGSIAGRINGLERPESNEGYALTNDASTDIISTSEEKNQENSEQAEESLFTEPDKREINENMINGRGLNIIQEHIEETAKKLDPGIVIKWDPNLDKGGSFNTYSKVLTLRADLTAAEAYVEIFKHEFMHDLELRGGYDKFLKFLENKSEAFAQYAKNVLKEYDRKYTGGNTGAVKALFDLYYEIYTTDERIMPVARKAFTLENAKREAAADFFADVFFKGKEYRSEMATALKYDNELPEGSYETSLSALEEIAHKDKNLFHRIIEAVKRFISNIKGNKTTRKLEADLKKLERKLQDVYESAETKKPTEDIGEKHNIGVLKNGNTYVIASRRIITSTDLPTMRKQISGFFDALLEEKGSLDIPTIDGDVLTISKKETADKARDNYKYENGKRIKMTNDEYAVKVRAESHIDELAETSKELPKQKVDSKNHPFAKNGFIYRIAYFEDFDGQYYQITLSVGKNGTVATIYNIGKIKKDKLPSAKLIAVVGSKPLGSLSSKHSIRQTSEKSQEKVSDSNREYLELAKEPEKNAAKLHELVENAAKEAGYSERLYHQTENNFTIFDTRHAGAGSRDNETPFGIFMKKTDADIGLKGKKQIGLFAKIEKPLKAYSRDSLVNSLERLSPEYKVIKEQLANLDKEYQEKVDNAHKEWQEWVAEWRNKNPNAKRVDAYNDPEFESVFSKEGEIVDEWSEKAATLDKKAKEIITSTLKSNDYDGIILLNDQGSFGRRTDAYIALEPSQVKSADPVTYDDNGNVIPLSERFNTENEDIRYSLKGDRLEELIYQRL